MDEEYQEWGFEDRHQYLTQFSEEEESNFWSDEAIACLLGLEDDFKELRGCF